MSEIAGIRPGSSFRGENPREVQPSELFRSCLRKACSERNIRLTGHAEERIVQRGIKIEVDDIEKITGAMQRAVEKGGVKSAIFCRDLVFIADAREKAIITAMNFSDRIERVFTGIDSVVFV